MHALTPSALLVTLADHDIRLSLDGDRLQVDAPAGSLTPDLRERLVAHKPELLAYLRHPQQGAGQSLAHTDTDPAQDAAPASQADDLEQAIRQATTWGDLETALERAQAAYQAGELTAEEVERLAAQAAQEAQTLPENTDELRLSDLFKEQPVRRVFSKALGEIVVFVADGVEIPPDNTLVVYRASELRQLVGCSLERLRAIHQAKRHLDGELVDDPGEDAILPAAELLTDDRALRTPPLPY